MKSKRKPNAQKSTTKQSSIRLSSKFSPEKQDHVYGFTLILAAVSTKGEDPVVQFISSTKSLVKDIKTVDPSACLVNLYNRKKMISDPALVPINQTALGAFVKVSTYGDKNPFNKQKSKDRNNKNNSNSTKKKKEEWSDPTVYFQVALASDTEPEVILERVRLEWFRIGGVRLQVKELQSLNVEATHVIYNLYEG